MAKKQKDNNKSKKKGYKCFQYALTVALNYEKINKDPQRISKIKPFGNVWKEIDFLSHGEDWRKFESNNKSIALNILYVPLNNVPLNILYMPHILYVPHKNGCRHATVECGRVFGSKTDVRKR